MAMKSELVEELCIAPGDFAELCHVVRDDDPNVALCGLDVTDVPWGNSADDCVVCAELERLPDLPRV